MRSFTLILILIALAGIVGCLARAAGKKEIEIRKIEPSDSEILEEWVRVTDEEDILGISASKIARLKWEWQVSIAVAEFVRVEPLETMLVDRVTTYLEKAKGVKAVAHEDREVWIIEGDATGADLVRAASLALESLAPELRKHMDSLQEDERRVSRS